MAGYPPIVLECSADPARSAYDDDPDRHPEPGGKGGNAWTSAGALLTWQAKARRFWPGLGAVGWVQAASGVVIARVAIGRAPEIVFAVVRVYLLLAWTVPAAVVSVIGPVLAPVGTVALTSPGPM